MSAAEDSPEWLSLDDDEEVVWIGEPALATLYGTIATGVVLLVVVIGALILLGVPVAYLGIKNTDYVATNKSLYVKKGILSTNIETVDLDRIQNIEFRQSFWGKQFDYGKILISTAGSSGAEIAFEGIPEANAVRDRIDELRANRVNRRDDGISRTPAADRLTGDTPASAEQLDELIEEVRATRKAFERIEERVVREASDGQTADGSRGSVTPPTAETEATSAEVETTLTDAEATSADTETIPAETDPADDEDDAGGSSPKE